MKQFVSPSQSTIPRCRSLLLPVETVGVSRIHHYHRAESAATARSGAGCPSSRRCPGSTTPRLLTSSFLVAQQQSPSNRRPFSVSAAEVEKFGAMQADWWNPRKNPLIAMNAIRVQYIRQQVVAASLRQEGKTPRPGSVPPLQALRAVDIGCGGGLLSESLVRLGCEQVTGIDPSVDLLAAAQTHADRTLLDPEVRGRLDYRTTTGEVLADKVTSGQEEAYDMVCLLEVIEHVRHPESLLAAASNLLRPGGLLFVSTMNRTIKSHCLTIVGAEYIMGYLPRGTHDWNLYRSPGEVRQLVDASGLREVDTSGMVLKRPPLLSFDWTLDPTDTDVNWIGTYVKDGATG